MILGAKARYAVMAMVELARRDAQVITLAELAAAQDIPLPYLEQIFAKLRRAGLVKSSRGPGGGYALAKSAAQIDIASVVMAVDESLKMTRCEGEAPGGCMSDKARCITHDLWEGLGQHIQSYLGSISLHDICENKLASSKSCYTEKSFDFLAVQ